jgi:gliding motility-associated protein GldM
MSAEKLSPRQKMIGMMYLVLTAMLALNVQREVLDAFVLINEGVETTNKSGQIRTELMLSEFKFANNLDPDKTGKYYEAATRISSQAARVKMHLDELNQLLIGETEGLTPEEADTINLKYVEKLEAMDVATFHMVGKNDRIETGKARELREILEAFENEINTELSGLQIEPVETGFDFSEIQKEGELVEWEMHTFYDMPLAAVVTMLNKTKTDVISAENEAISRLLANVDRDDFPVDTVLARVVPESKYVLQGQAYKSEIFLGAYSTTLSPEIFIGDLDDKGKLIGQGEKLNVEDGVAFFEKVTSQLGLSNYEGVVRMADKRGNIKEFPFKSEYLVAAPTAVVSPTAMNVLYVGVDNPLSISVPGIPDKQVQVSINGGNHLVKQASGAYLAKMNLQSPNDVEVTVRAELDGTMREMNNVKFRVKRLPAPKCRVGSIEGSGKMKASDLKIQNLICEYEKDFPLNLPRPQLVSFSMVIQTGDEVKERMGTTNRLTEEMKALIERTPPGSRVYFENIMVKGNDEKSHKLPPVVVTIIR